MFLNDLWQPIVFDNIEGCGILNIINNNNRMCSTIISLCQRSKSLLSSSIPYLQLDEHPININRLEPKIHTNSRHQWFLKLLINKAT